jgi:hypothetical protein
MTGPEEGVGPSLRSKDVGSRGGCALTGEDKPECILAYLVAKYAATMRTFSSGVSGVETG